MLRHFKDPRFQLCFSVLPRPIQRLARKNFKLLLLTLDTLRCISSVSAAICGQLASAVRIVPWQFGAMAICTGFGSDTTPSTMEWSAEQVQDSSAGGVQPCTHTAPNQHQALRISAAASTTARTILS
jgi:hypothetical protein